MKKRRSFTADLLLGAAAGFAATWVMDRVTTKLYEAENEEAQRAENEARGGKTAYVVAAEKGAALAQLQLSEKAIIKAGSAIHWSIGVAAGAKYGLARRFVPRFGIGSGLAWGLAIWLLLDEGLNTALGLTPPPDAFPWETHIRGLVGHLVLGGVIEGVFDAADTVSYLTAGRGGR